MQRLEVSGAVRPIYESLGVKRLSNTDRNYESSKITNTLCNYQREYPSLDGFVITT